MSQASRHMRMYSRVSSRSLCARQLTYFVTSGSCAYWRKIASASEMFAFLSSERLRRVYHSRRVRLDMIAKCKVEPKNIQEIEAALRFLQSDCFLQPCFR